MRARALAEVAAAVGGTVVPPERGSDVVSGAVRTDSREVMTGDLFFALAGERSDGHAFAGAALEAGAVAVVVHRDVAFPGPLIRVPDTGAALLALARAERAASPRTVVGITGSTGKTSTKDLAAAVLRGRFRVAASPASFNNEVGLPLTILGASQDTEVLVCEMGSRGPGHIRLLCEVARPQIGVVTNVGVAHMELFGSSQALRDAKAELPEALPSTGTAVLNADDAVVRGYGARTEAEVVLFGASDDADIRAEDVRVDRETGNASFELATPAGRASVLLRVPGEHMVPNALAAAAVGWSLGMQAGDIAGGLAKAAVTGGRMEVLRTPSGLRIINDAYNANPTSMAAALRAARWMAGDRTCVAVLGVMAELGPISVAEHERVGELLARLGVDALVAVGPEAKLIAVGAEREGVEPDRIVLCDTPEEAAASVGRFAGPGDLVLVKGSRVARLERVVEVLVAARSEAPSAGDGDQRGTSR